jgi:hypothetical protein
MRLDYGFKAQVGVSEALGGSPYGATTIADVDGSRQPHAEENLKRFVREYDLYSVIEDVTFEIHLP